VLIATPLAAWFGYAAYSSLKSTTAAKYIKWNFPEPFGVLEYG